MRRTQGQIKEEIVKYKVYQENDRWYGHRMCLDCKNYIKHSSIERSILLRTIRNLEKKQSCY